MKIFSEPGMVEAWYGSQMNRITLGSVATSLTIRVYTEWYREQLTSFLEVGCFYFEEDY